MLPAAPLDAVENPSGLAGVFGCVAPPDALTAPAPARRTFTTAVGLARLAKPTSASMARCISYPAARALARHASTVGSAATAERMAWASSFANRLTVSSMVYLARWKEGSRRTATERILGAGFDGCQDGRTADFT